MTRLSEYAGTRELLVNLTLRELRGRYKKSLLGWTWSLLNPLSTVLIFSMVFSFFLKVEPPTGHPSGIHNFAVFLLCGLVAWNYISNSMGTCAEALVGNSNLIKKVYFPREIIVVAMVASLLVSFLIELGILTVILLLLGNMVLPWIPVVLFLVVLETCFVLGLGLMISAFNVYFRDVKHLIGIALQALFYSAPIVYPLRLVYNATRDHLFLRHVYLLNPIVRLIGAFRAVLYDLRFPSVFDVLYIAGWGVGMLAVGLLVFARLDRRLAEEV